MKKTILIAALLALPFVAGCKKQLYHLTGVINVEELYSINDADGFYEDTSRWISGSDILDELNLPDNSEITGVQIERITVDLIRKAGSGAARANVSAEVRLQGQTAWLPVFSNFPVSLNSAHIVIDSTYNAAGIALIKNQINAYIAAADPVLEENIQMHIIVAATGSPVIEDLTVRIEGTVNYDTCLEVPEWFSGGEECTIE
jgi:hypothetical protein